MGIHPDQGQQGLVEDREGRGAVRHLQPALTPQARARESDGGLCALPSPRSPSHIRPMAKPPDSKKARDPARPTRAQDAREPLAPIAPALEKLLNPGIAKGTAGVGSQTGLNNAEKSAKRANAPLPGGDGWTEKGPKTGLQPPADNSWARPQDFSAAHRARRSVSSPLLGPKVSEPIQKAPTTSTSLPNPPLQGGREHTESGE